MRGMIRMITRRARFDEAGGTLIFVAIAMVVLIGFAALAIDLGRAYGERRELQTGADAGALAIAYDCVAGLCGGAYDEASTADTFADLNVKDGTATISEVALDTGAGTVRVETRTEDELGNNDFDMLLATVLGVIDFDIRADATVAWGPFGGGVTLPLAFSECEWEQFGEPGFVEDGGFLHRKASVDAGLLPPASGYAYASEYVRIYFHGDQEVDEGLDCHESPSGQDLAGGFGWLYPTSGCSRPVEIGEWVPVDPGEGTPNACRVALDSLIGEVVLIPYFDDLRDTGAGAEYQIAGIGALYVTGFSFPAAEHGSIIPGETDPCPLQSTSDRCMEGYMIGDWVAEGGDIGGPDFGVNVVKFID
jgi:Flp pilus assembly protein TadG